MIKTLYDPVVKEEGIKEGKKEGKKESKKEVALAAWQRYLAPPDFCRRLSVAVKTG